MKRLPVPVLAASLLLAAGGTWLLVKPSNDKPARSPAPDRVQTEVVREDAALQAEVARLRRDVADLARRSEQAKDPAQEAPAPDDPEAAPAEAPPPKTPEERRQAQRQAHERWKSGLHTIAEREPLDPQWTSQMREEVTSAFAKDAGTEVRSVQCHESLCEVQLAHSDRQALETLKEDMGSTLHYPMTLLHEPDGDSFKSVLFIAREGESLPDWRQAAEGRESQL